MDAAHLLNRFLNRIDSDPRIGTTHIAAYMALYRCWLEADCPEKIEIKGKQIRTMAKISSSATWHRAVRSLSEYGYILYCPTFDKTARTVVYMTI